MSLRAPRLPSGPPLPSRVAACPTCGAVTTVEPFTASEKPSWYTVRAHLVADGRCPGTGLLVQARDTQVRT